MEKIIIDTPDLKVTRETGDGQSIVHLQITLHIDPAWYQDVLSCARSANVSVEEYVTECAKDGLIRGYR